MDLIIVKQNTEKKDNNMQWQVKSNYDIAKKLSFLYPRTGQNVTSAEDNITQWTQFYINPNYESCKLQKQHIEW